MITIREEPNVKPLSTVGDFELGSTFKYNARYYFVVQVESEEDEPYLDAFDLATGESIGKYKHGRLYPVNFIMTVEVV